MFVQVVYQILHIYVCGFRSFIQG